MAWRPSRDPNLQVTAQSGLWAVLEPVFDKAYNLDPLPRGSSEDLDSSFIRDREGDSSVDVLAMQSRLPKEFASFDLGSAAIEVLDFLLNCTRGRILNIIGRRGAGKTSLLHFVEDILAHAKLPDAPHLIIINGNKLAEKLSTLQPVTLEDYLNLLIDEIRGRLSTFPADLQPALRDGLQLLGCELSFANVRRAAQAIGRKLPDTDRLVFVFDSLDHLDPAAVQIALELAKQIYVESNLGSIVCLRPGSLTRAVDRGAARAFFTYRLQLGPPSVRKWLECFPDQMAKATTKLQERGSSLRIYNLSLTADLVCRAMNRFTELLHGRRWDDDALRFLAAISAEDTRHLLILVRRILSNPSLPDRQILGLPDDRLFHPLTAMIEGDQKWFRGSAAVPNLICFDASDGNVELLLQHRILILLNTGFSVATEQLIRWLKLLGYSRQTSLEALDLLRKAQLIEASNLEIAISISLFPDEVALTRAGVYYLNYLIRFADYLALAVLDTPLQHRSFLSHPEGEGFSSRLESLVEYLEEVKIQEQGQITQLARQSPSPELRRVADSLRNGGLLTDAVLQAIRSVVQRSKDSSSTRVKELVKHLEARLSSFEGSIEDMELRLIEVANRGRKSTIPDDAPIITGLEGTIRLEAHTIGDELHLKVDLEPVEEMHSALIGFSAMVNKHPLLLATVAVVQPEPQSSMDATSRSLLKAAFPPSLIEGATLEQSCNSGRSAVPRRQASRLPLCRSG